jgi:hypothetical protein
VSTIVARKQNKATPKPPKHQKTRHNATSTNEKTVPTQQHTQIDPYHSLVVANTVLQLPYVGAASSFVRGQQTGGAGLAVGVFTVAFVQPTLNVCHLFGCTWKHPEEERQ